MNHRLHAFASLVAGAVSGSYTPFLKPVWDGEERAAIDAWRKGEAQEELAASLAHRLGLLFGPDFCIVPTNSGRAAIQLALQAMRLPAGSEVLLPSYSCTGVIVPVVQARLAPVLVDVDADLNISLASVAEAAGAKVKALILPHLAGVAVHDAAPILDWARSRGIRVIEDAAQSFGLRVGGQLAGTIGDAGVFSSGGGKPLFGPGGGWVASRDPRLAEALRSMTPPAEEPAAVERRVRAFLDAFLVGSRARSRKLLTAALRGYGRRFLEMLAGRPSGEIEPYTFPLRRISGVEAGVAIGQIGKIPSIIEGRSRNAAAWRAKLPSTGIPGLRLPPEEANVFTKFWIQCEGVSAARYVQVLKAALWRAGVETESLYVPLHLRAPFARHRRVSLPVTEARWRLLFCVPVRPDLGPADWGRIDAALDDARRVLGTAS